MTFPNKDTLLVIDGDILLYSVGWGSEDIEQSWIVDQRIENFFKRLFTKFETYNYKAYLTGKGNFREQAATTHKYKGNRKPEKPKWYKYIKDYLLHMHNTVVIEGMEADDGMAMNITRNNNSILCSIDKDLWMVEGWHYSWSTHNSPEKPLRYIKNDEGLTLLEGKRKKLIGGGYPWFYAQLLMGDKTDNIVGPKGYGDVKAYKALQECETEKDYYAVVKEVYEEEYGEQAEDRLLENAQLLWMVKELDDDGEFVMWEKPE